MKRFLLGLIMVGGLALAAAPMANAATAVTAICGAGTASNHYAISMVGAEPSVASSANQQVPLAYIAGVGTLTFGPYNANANGPGVGGCTITSGEMIYVDNDYLTFQGGPQNCPSITSEHGVPCFDGGDHVVEGGVAPGPNGGATVEVVMDFPFVVGASETPLPFSFTLFASSGGNTLVGNSNIPTNPDGISGSGGTPGNPSCTPYDPVTGCGPFAPAPPLGPVLSFTGQKQSASVALVPVPTVAGAAPYIGNSATLCNGFGGPSNDGVAVAEDTQPTEPSGAYGATSGSLTEFANGYSFGSLTFNENDDVGNTLGPANYDCDFQEQSFQRYGDGTTNNQAAIYDENWPFAISPVCYDGDADTVAPGVGGCLAAGEGTDPSTGMPTAEACCTGLGTSTGAAPCNTGGAVGADEVNSSVVWGTSDQDTFTIVTGVASPALDIAGNPYLPPGSTTSCTGLQESATPGALAAKASPTTDTDSGPTYPQTKSTVITVTNTSEGACSVGAELIHESGAGTYCTMTLSAPGVVSEGDGPQSSPWTANCTCTGKNGRNVEQDIYVLGFGAGTSPTGVGGCPSPAAWETPTTLTCQN